MAKPIIKFSAVPYQVGTGAQTRTGYRPQLESQNGLYDLDFCQEVVTEKRLAMSPEELLHAMEMVGEVGPAKVTADGRPRGITKLLKYNRYAQGNLESPTSAWDPATCKAYVRAQLMADAEKVIDASFQNILSGVGVRLNYVAWVGAQSVTNVVKIGKTFAAYGNHMEFITGDTATLTVGSTAYSLTCTESDVAHAVFAWPAGLAPEAGTTAEFLMKSRGGVEDGEVYTSKKTVTILANDGPTITGVKQDNLADGHLKIMGGKITISGFSILRPNPSDTVKFELYNGTTLDAVINSTNAIEENTETKLVLTAIVNDSGKDDSYWANKDATLAMTLGSTRITYPVHFDPSV